MKARLFIIVSLCVIIYTGRGYGDSREELAKHYEEVTIILREYVEKPTLAEAELKKYFAKTSENLQKLTAELKETIPPMVDAEKKLIKVLDAEYFYANGKVEICNLLIDMKLFKRVLEKGCRSPTEQLIDLYDSFFIVMDEYSKDSEKAGEEMMKFVTDNEARIKLVWSDIKNGKASALKPIDPNAMDILSKRATAMAEHLTKVMNENPKLLSNPKVMDAFQRFFGLFSN